jgi:hypothetical protein
MSFLYERNKRLYVAKQTAGAFSTIRNTAGAADVAAADACKHRSFTAEPTRTRLAAPDVESTAFLGYIDRTIAGRFGAAPASTVTSLFSATGAGVQPDIGPILESAFGKVTIAAGVSATYGPAGVKYLDEASPITCELWEFVTGAKRGKVAFGALVNRFVIAAGQDYADLTADYLCFNVLTQDRFPAASTSEKGGLTAWPTEPSQTYTGSPLTGFTMTLTLDGIVYTTVRSVSVTGSMGRQFRADKTAVDGSEYLPTEPFEMMPEFTLDFSVHSTDASDLSALIAKIAARTQFDASLVIGNAAGGTYTIPLNNLISPEGREAVHGGGDDRAAVTVSGLRAQATSTSVRDECTVVLT